MELTNENILKGIELPHNKWRLTAKETEAAPNSVSPRYTRMIAAVKRLREMQLPVDDIKAMLSDLYWDAFVEHELQVKEATGKSVKEHMLAKIEPTPLPAPLVNNPA